MTTPLPAPRRRVLLAAPGDWCVGVDRAIAAVEDALQRYGPPVYVRHEIVHAADVIETLRAGGAVFVDETDQVPEGGLVVFSTHGVAPHVREEAARRRLTVIDAACPLVTQGVVRSAHEVGRSGEASVDPMPVDGAEDCHGPQSRRAAVERIAAQAALVLVVGSKNSSGSVRLVEAALAAGAESARGVDGADEIDERWLRNVCTVGVTSGASAPEGLVEGVLDWLAARGYTSVEPVTGAGEQQPCALPRQFTRRPRSALVREVRSSSVPSPSMQRVIAGADTYLSACLAEDGCPTAWLAFDARFERRFTGSQARALLRHRFEDPGFDLADEAFSAMLTLMLCLPPADAVERELVARLPPLVEECRWHHRYRFFPGISRFPADTDCTAMATGALYEHGLLPGAVLDQGAEDLLRAAAPLSSTGERGVHAGVLMVYWEDGAEPGTLPRGRKHDAVACANAVYTLHLSRHRITGDGEAVLLASLRHLRAHLASGRYRHGTRYYPSPDAFLFAASRICARFPEHSRMLTAPLSRAVRERGAHRERADDGGADTALDVALRTLAADNLALDTVRDGGRRLLAECQQPDGSWPACAYYRMGRFPVYFGSPYLTTLFARKALTSVRPRHETPP